MRFPNKPDECELNDRLWETYCIEVWCCNSLNERECTAKHDGREFDSTMFRRAQDVIWFLLEETGRMEEWNARFNKED